ncbi:sialidase family protein [Castellaniella defragrans]|uniref:sialidase family protein n=1 Tax=Castellaniella defragrans TaxID=75697 RepID=UPI0023F082C1|nr:sialidase family protein [Castellaniella defragrans]
MNTWLSLLLSAVLAAAPWSLSARTAVPAAASHSHHGANGAPVMATSAAFGPDGRLWTASADDGRLSVRHSDDLGRTFSAPVLIDVPAGSVLTMGEDRPMIATGPRGEIYVAWTRSLPRPYTGHILFSRSVDGGRHFSTPVRVHRDDAEITHRLAAMSVDAEGRVLIAWIDRRDFQAAKARGEPYAGTAVYYAWSDDAGARFGPERRLADHSCDCCRIAAAPAPAGGIGLLWRFTDADELRDHAYAEVRDGTVAREAARATYTGWRVDACPHQGPGLALAADGTRHAVWFSAKDGEPVIWYGQLRPGQPPGRLLAVAREGAAHADVAAADGRVWIVWNQADADGLKLMARVSADAGAHFGAARELARTDADAGSPQVLLDRGGRAYAAWGTADGLRLVPLTGTEGTGQP